MAIDRNTNSAEETRDFRIDLGCGNRKVKGTYGVDNVAVPGVDVVADLDSGLPFRDGSIDGVYAYHILEHVDNFLETMNEIWRVCKDGALVHVKVPHSASTYVTWKDPTHRRGLSIATFAYFDDTYFDGAAFAYYATARFRIEHAQLNFNLSGRDENVKLSWPRRLMGAIVHRLANRNRRWQYFCERFWGPIVGIEEAVLTMRAQKKPRPSTIPTASPDEIAALKR
ncbi:MAG: class I SAM-dependent methyltransferase [Planctomycetes bacterium]|nr:class I SAM-dependent methyltransferase [Planctomycetota bacterium]